MLETDLVRSFAETGIAQTGHAGLHYVRYEHGCLQGIASVMSEEWLSFCHTCSHNRSDHDFLLRLLRLVFPPVMASQTQFDYIIVGGGLSGCVVAARLHEAHPSLSIALLEAGPDESHNPAVLSPVLYPTLHGTPLQYSYLSTSQPQIEGRKVPNWGGRLRQSFEFCLGRPASAS